MATPAQKSEKTIYELFRWSIIIKAAGALGEMLGGILIADIPNELVLRVSLALAQGDVGTEADDFILRQLLGATHWLAVSNTLLIGIYLFFRGFIQVALTYELFKNRLWAYPGLLIVMTAFVITQMYDIFHSHSLPTIALTIFDLVTMYLIWHEYRIVRTHSGTRR